MLSRSPRPSGTASSAKAELGRTSAAARAAVLAGAFLVEEARAEAPRTSFAGFGGVMTDNTWEDVIFETGSLTFRDAGAVGASVSREWPLGRAGFVGLEAAALQHFGEQTHQEVSAPVYLRSVRPEPALIPNLAYGLGLSYATRVPEVEVDRTGESQRLLAYWFIELEFGGAQARTRPFFRLHHRSDAFGVFPNDTGSNLLLLGLRRDF